MDNAVKPIYEFILWNNCRNNCKFCWQKTLNSNSSDQEKVESIFMTRQFLESDQFVSGSHVLLVGGELFDTPSCSNAELELTRFLLYVIELMCADRIDLLYINTNLLHTNMSLFKFFMDAVQSKNLVHRLKFTTSWDIEGRFSHDTLRSWHNMLDLVKRDYPDVNVVVNTILTSKLCDSVLNDDNNFIVELHDKYGYHVNLLPYIVLDNTLTPDRSDIFKTLAKIDSQIPGYLNTYVTSMCLDQTKHVFRSTPTGVINQNCDSLECGHPSNFTKYSAHGSCFVCDLKEAFCG